MNEYFPKIEAQVVEGDYPAIRTRILERFGVNVDWTDWPRSSGRKCGVSSSTKEGKYHRRSGRTPLGKYGCATASSR